MAGSLYLGIDVQAKELFLALLERVGAGLLLRRVLQVPVEVGERVPGLVALLPEIAAEGAKVGIDAPRVLLERGRRWQWSRRERAWAKARQPLRGRHCEIVLRAAGLGNPQWTPLADEAPGWMRTGRAAFRECEGVLGEGNVFEVFPTASYIQMQRMEEVLPLLLCEPAELSRYPRRAKDILDAATAGLTVALLDEGRAMLVPGGDGLGGILIPGGLQLAPGMEGILTWPE